MRQTCRSSLFPGSASIQPACLTTTCRSSFFSWIILLAPLISAVFITLFALRWKAVSSFISIAAVLVSFACSCLIFTQSGIAAAEFTWINIGGALKVPLGFTLDQLSKTMLLIVSGVGATIHIYSLGYM